MSEGSRSTIYNPHMQRPSSLLNNYFRYLDTLVDNVTDINVAETKGKAYTKKTLLRRAKSTIFTKRVSA